MKDLKKKLTAAAAMLVVSAVMLSGVSYAWYTLSTNPEVSNIKANIAANENLEIALDDGYTSAEGTTDGSVDYASNNTAAGGVQGSTTGNPYTWGNTINLTKALQDNDGNALVTLQPVSYTTAAQDQTNKFADVNINYPTYGTDGRVSAVVAAGKHIVSDYNGAGTKGGVYYYTNTASDSNEQGQPYAFSMTYWMRSNTATSVKLSSDALKLANDNSTTDTSKVNGATGNGSYIKLPITGNNSADVIQKFANNIVISVVDETDGTIVGYARLGTAKVETSAVTYPLTLESAPNKVQDSDEKTITLEKTKGKKLTTYVYLDGATMTNSEALISDLTGMELNLQFTASTALDNAMTGDTVTN